MSYQLNTAPKKTTKNDWLKIVLLPGIGTEYQANIPTTCITYKRRKCQAKEIWNPNKISEAAGKLS